MNDQAQKPLKVCLFLCSFMHSHKQQVTLLYMNKSSVLHQLKSTTLQILVTKFIHFFAGCGESPEFRGQGDSSERTRHPWGLPPPAGNTWLFSTCISRQCYTNLNQPHFKYLSPNSFTFLQDAVKVQSSEAEETAVKGPDTPGDSHHQQVTLGSSLHA